MNQTVSAAQKVPNLQDKVTEKNVMSLLNKYDSDGAYIMQTAINNGDNVPIWWHNGDTITSSISTAVHEECHVFTHMTAPFNTENIYIGNKKKINIKYTDVYESKEMARTIPKNLRTFRYSTYVGKPTPNLSSNIKGVYGLLNEFTAYYWGMHAEVSLFPYFKKFPATDKLWENYITIGASERLAYAEFKYYILKYLVYAKKHYPSIYKGIINNKNFISAYNKIEHKFAKLNETYDKHLKDIVELLNKNGYKAEYNQNTFKISEDGYSYTIYSLFKSDYDKLLKELNKSEYKKIIKAI